MTKKIDIIITKDNFKENSSGTILSVSYGYAFNYLLPNKIAELATPKKIKHIQMFKTIEQKNKEAQKVAINELKQKIEKIKKISIHKKTGENSLIFGRITEKDIVNWFFKYTNLVINRKDIKTVNIKKSGIYYIEVYLGKDITHKMILRVVPTNI
uniref:Large ribosomal subunit protein bL9c n=1 Tax=Alsidium seaforthii TaxID=2007182 RepID=A0A1Z1MDW1_9FLOR|nr:ribosomal protein L9 [Bryothamnion seaforthii]ARW64025.1 ribosomal protein L9 [Bryothamnion seaforthii]